MIPEKTAVHGIFPLLKNRTCPCRALHGLLLAFSIRMINDTFGSVHGQTEFLTKFINGILCNITIDGIFGILPFKIALLQ